MPRERNANPAGRFVWEVDRAGYRWSREHELAPLTSNVGAAVREQPQGPWLVAPHAWDTRSKVVRYAPLWRRRDLHLEFGRLRPGDDPAALAAMARFASNFGLLGVTQLVHPAREQGAQLHLYHAEHLSSWREAISSVGALEELISAYKRVDVEKLRTFVKWHRDPLRVVFSYRFAEGFGDRSVVIARQGDGCSEEELARWSAAREPERLLGPTEHFLYGEVNRHLADHVAPQLIPRVGMVDLPKSLLGALYMMAAQQFFGSWPTKSCPNCGASFVPRSRSDQKTCSPACKQTLYRLRRDQAGLGQ